MEPKRSLKANEVLLHQCLGGGSVSMQSLNLDNESSLLCLEPGLFIFLFAGIHFIFHVYSILRFEPMHNLSLGII